MDVERTLIIVKPDGVQRGLSGEIISRLERRGLKLVALKMIWIDKGLAEEHYAEHRGKGFFEDLIAFITSSPVVVGVLEGPDAVNVTRGTMGATSPVNAAPGTIRADFGLTVDRNLIHGSDGEAKAKEEIARFFKPGEIYDYERSIEPWIVK